MNNNIKSYEAIKQRSLKRVRFDIDESDDITGVTAISIVDKPAIGSDFVALKSKAKANPERVRIHVQSCVAY